MKRDISSTDYFLQWSCTLTCRYLGKYRVSGFFRVSQILWKKGKLVHCLFCGNYFLWFKTKYKFFIWHIITYLIFTCFIFGKIKMVAKNAKIRLPPYEKKKPVIRYSSHSPVGKLLYLGSLVCPGLMQIRVWFSPISNSWVPWFWQCSISLTPRITVLSL
jgi:hypothetical protein